MAAALGAASGWMPLSAVASTSSGAWNPVPPCPVRPTGRERRRRSDTRLDTGPRDDVLVRGRLTSNTYYTG